MLRRTEREVRREISKRSTPLLKRVVGEVVIFTSRQMRRRFGEIEDPPKPANIAEREGTPEELRIEWAKRIVDFFLEKVPIESNPYADKMGIAEAFNNELGDALTDETPLLYLVISSSFPWSKEDEDSYSEKHKQIHGHFKSQYNGMINSVMRSIHKIGIEPNVGNFRQLSSAQLAIVTGIKSPGKATIEFLRTALRKRSASQETPTQ